VGLYFLLNFCINPSNNNNSKTEADTVHPYVCLVRRLLQCSKNR